MIEMTDSVQDLLKAWDDGDTIWSIELGGLGPGYEQAIQVCAVEIARKLKDYSPAKDKGQMNRDVSAIADKVVGEIDNDLGGIVEVSR